MEATQILLIVIVILIACIIYLCFCLWISQYYRETLKKEIEFLEKQLYKLNHQKLKD